MKVTGGRDCKGEGIKRRDGEEQKVTEKAG